MESTPTATCIERTDLSNGDLDCCIVKLLSCLGASADVSVDRDQSAILAQYNTFIRENSLQAVNPQLASEWHPTKNGGLLPENVPAGSGKKAWWLCPVCHGEWQTRIVERNQGKGCPFCANQKVLPGFNDLSTRSPELAAEWHPTRNGTLLPTDVVWRSNKKAWWLCQRCGHEWQAQISSRQHYGFGCPKCGVAKRVITQRQAKIQRGATSLSEKFPALAAEWHPTKNGDLTPENVTCGSGIKAWWKCSKCGEEWQQAICSRTRYGATGCLCCRRKRTASNQAMSNQDFVIELRKTHPSVEVIGVYVNSHTKIGCRCTICGYEWQVLPYSLLRLKVGCPECAREQVVNGRRKNPGIFAEELKACNPNVVALEQYINSSTKLLCRCLVCSNEWRATPSKLLLGRGCPHCSKARAAGKMKTTQEDFLNHLHEINPKIEVLGEYVNARTPILCQCRACGHKWNGTPSNLLRGTGCPKCARRKK